MRAWMKRQRFDWTALLGLLLGIAVLAFIVSFMKECSKLSSLFP